MLRDLTSPRVICVKGMLFLLCGCLAAAALLVDSPSLKTAALLAVAVWSFARFYYFAFYVLQRYVDPSYRFSGLLSLLTRVIAKRKR